MACEVTCAHYCHVKEGELFTSNSALSLSSYVVTGDQGGDSQALHIGWIGRTNQPTKPTICYHHTKPQCTKNTQPLCTSVYAYYAGALLVKPNDSKPTDTNEEGRPKQSAMQTILGSGVWGRGSKRASKRPTPLIQPSFPPSHSLPNLPVSCRLFPLPMITVMMCSFSDQLQIMLEKFGH